MEEKEEENEWICDECGEGKSPRWHPDYLEFKMAGGVAPKVCPNMCELR